ncbi:hypothetical protein BDW67DRAFT_142594 [Aspergillus spinulosporus]
MIHVRWPKQRLYDVFVKMESGASAPAILKSSVRKATDIPNLKFGMLVNHINHLRQTPPAIQLRIGQKPSSWTGAMNPKLVEGFSTNDRKLGDFVDKRSNRTLYFIIRMIRRRGIYTDAQVNTNHSSAIVFPDHCDIELADAIQGAWALHGCATGSWVGSLQNPHHDPHCSD